MIYVISAAIIFTLASFLVLHCQYEDGIVGRLALAGLAVSEFVVINEWYVEGGVNEVLPTTVTINVFVALFLLRHVYRFLRYRTTGAHAWRPAKK